MKSELATFFKAFPGWVAWSNHREGEDHDLILSGQVTPTVIDLDKLSQRFQRPDYNRVTNSLIEVKTSSLIELLSTDVAQQADLTTWLADAEINTDRNLRLQYIAGFGRNLKDENSIYRTLRSFRRLPAQLFVGSPENIEALNKAIGTSPGGE